MTDFLLWLTKATHTSGADLLGFCVIVSVLVVLGWLRDALTSGRGR